MPIKSWYPTYNIRIVRAASHPSGVDQAVREVVFYSIGNGKISWNGDQLSEENCLFRGIG